MTIDPLGSNVDLAYFEKYKSAKIFVSEVLKLWVDPLVDHELSFDGSWKISKYENNYINMENILFMKNMYVNK